MGVLLSFQTSDSNWSEYLGLAISQILIRPARYAPGHVVVFRSSALYHGVQFWTPRPMKSTTSLTPGRISWVFFTHVEMVEHFKDKGARWNLETGMGHHPETLMDWVPPRSEAKGDGVIEADGGYESELTALSELSELRELD